MRRLLTACLMTISISDVSNADILNWSWGRSLFSVNDLSAELKGKNLTKIANRLSPEDESYIKSEYVSYEEAELYLIKSFDFTKEQATIYLRNTAKKEKEKEKEKEKKFHSYEISKDDFALRKGLLSSLLFNRPDESTLEEMGVFDEYEQYNVDDIQVHVKTMRPYWINQKTGLSHPYEYDHYYFDSVSLDNGYNINGVVEIRMDLTINTETGVVTDKDGNEYEEVIGQFMPVDKSLWPKGRPETDASTIDHEVEFIQQW